MSRTSATTRTTAAARATSATEASATTRESALTVTTDSLWEFVGPLTGWKNVKTDYGAVGDGVTDDTTAIQTALTALGNHTDHNVLYFPAGAYRITDTVSTTRTAHTHCMGITVVGEDPATTTIVWDGTAGGLMVRYDAWYSKFSRLTLDGAGTAGTCLGYGPAFSTYNETSDCVFQDAAVGMQMATGANGQAENMVLRCRFLRCSDKGLTTVNFNSMDIWCWYCRFADCGYALYNGAGNFHAYECLFERSTICDVRSVNLMAFSFVNNVSVGSARFLDFTDPHVWGAPTTISGNRILDVTGDRAMVLDNAGPYLVMDNVIRHRVGATAPLVDQTTMGEQLFVANTYSLASAVTFAGNHREIGETVVDRATIDGSLPTLPGTPPNQGRAIYEVPGGSNAATVQAAIDSAVSVGNRAVVHLQKGTYDIATMLTVPAGAEIQILGDGASETATVLNWTGAAGGTLLKLAGPVKALVADLQITSGAGNGLLLDTCDQAGGHVHTAQLRAEGAAETPLRGIYVNGVENSDVTLLAPQGGVCTTLLTVTGGPVRAAGGTTDGQVNLYNGATGTSATAYAVSAGARLVVRGNYHEWSGAGPRIMALTDHGTLAIDATRFSYQWDAATSSIEVSGWSGILGLFSCLFLNVATAAIGWLRVTGAGTNTTVALMASMFWDETGGRTADDVWLDNSSPAATAGMALCNLNSGGTPPYAALASRGTLLDATVLAALAPIRTATIPRPLVTETGVTSALLHRVSVISGAGRTAIELRRTT